MSPQELRQALFPGPFSDWVDSAAAESEALKSLLNLSDPDYRMRDIEVLSRFLAFRFFLEQYRGRMKRFLDFAFETFNNDWEKWQPRLQTALEDFESAVMSLTVIFGSLAGKKPGSRQFNRAVFDFLVFYAQEKSIRDAMVQNSERLKERLENLFLDAEFKSATERDTAGVPNTIERLSKWGNVLSEVINKEFPIPTADEDNEGQRIAFPGFSGQ